MLPGAPHSGADAHRNSVERIFPKLGETAATGEILDTLENTAESG
jgi:hypothetical protein